MDLSLFFAGTAGSVPTARRGLPAILLRAGGERILLDCGEGTQQQLLRSAGLPELDAVFLTHFHLDHWLGLVGMLKTFDLRAREKPLAVHGPPGLKLRAVDVAPDGVHRRSEGLQLGQHGQRDEIPGVQDRVRRAQALEAAVREPAAPARQVRVGDHGEAHGTIQP